ncbi:MAG: hypothetical protein ACYSUI_08415, partial [Planctomycetota bacterium]
NSHLANWLGRARTMKGAGRERAVDRLMTGEEERLGPLSKEKRGQRRQMLLATAQEAAQMSDTEFELSREELVVRIAPADRRAELNKQIDELELALGRPGKTVRLMLNRDMDPVLRLRYRQLGRQPSARRTDLALGPQADNCDQGCFSSPGRTVGCGGLSGLRQRAGLGLCAAGRLAAGDRLLRSVAR